MNESCFAFGDRCNRALSRRWRGAIGSGKSAALARFVSNAMDEGKRPIAWLAAVSDVGLRTERVVFSDHYRAQQLGVEAFEGRLVRDLSSGERQRVRLALALARGVRFAALDEPCRHLDPQHITVLERVLQQCNRQGVELGICDLRQQLGAHIFNEERGTPETPKTEPFACGPGGNNVISLQVPTPFLLSSISQRQKATGSQTIRLRSQSLIVLTGPNGGGKTSLLTAIANAARQNRMVYGYSRQEPEHQVFAIDAEQEFAQIATVYRPGVRGGLALMHKLGLKRWLREPTPRLPLGVMCLLGAAIALQMGRDLVLLDEPTQGQDVATVRAFVQELVSCCHQGATVIVASHDPELVRVASDVWDVENGILSTNLKMDLSSGGVA